MNIKSHLFPTTVEEAVEMLRDEKGRARLISGGTDLVVEIRNGKNEYEVLVDTSRIQGLDAILVKDRVIKIGPRVTMEQAEHNEAIKKGGTALAEGCSSVGGPQIRNRATIAGNIVSAQPAADAAIPLFVLNARLDVVGIRGNRTVNIEDAYKGVGKSAIDPSAEFITSIYFEKQTADEVSVFKRMMRREALTLPILNCAIWIKRKDDCFEDVRIAVGPVASTPLRMKEAENILKGNKINFKAINKTTEIVREIASPRSSPFRGSAEYRKEMVGVILSEAFEAALAKLDL